MSNGMLVWVRFIKKILPERAFFAFRGKGGSVMRTGGSKWLPSEDEKIVEIENRTIKRF